MTDQEQVTSEAPVTTPPEPEVEEEVKEVSLYDLFSTESTLEKKGVTVDYGAAGQFQVARAGGANSLFTKVTERVMRPYRRLHDQGLLDEALAKELVYEIFAESIVLAWEGVKNRKGELIPFTKQNCIKLFKDLPDLFADLQEFSLKGANFQNDDVEGDAGNL